MTMQRLFTATGRVARREALASAALALILAGAAPGASAQAQTDPAAALRARFVALRDALQQNDFKRPLVLESTQTAGDLKGDIHALVAHPFERDLAESDRITLEQWQRRGIDARLKELLARAWEYWL